MIEAYKDDSIFQGWLAFETDDGQRVRAEEMGDGWHIYLLDDEGEAYVHEGVVITRSKTPKKIWQHWEKRGR